ncbi:hypothetical protein CHK_1660 [Christensenella hongkongensis]|uniref:Uncharacterized protein n=1 Tax=Christensenella hongkongensis TaxID=270498 RepID=A0A0M2NEB2_9FIRM|nr:hypothetical protein CHK_1660 [Christensenella hongkongensis]
MRAYSRFRDKLHSYFQWIIYHPGKKNDIVLPLVKILQIIT